MNTSTDDDDRDPHSPIFSFLQNEEANLIEIQKVVTSSVSSILRQTDEKEGAISVSKRLAFLEQSDQRYKRRRVTLDQLSQDLNCPPDQVRIKHCIRDCDEEHSEYFVQQLETLRKKIAQTIGQQRVFALLLFSRQRIVESTLANLGVSNMQDRYNAAGEKLTSQSTPLIQTR